MKSFSYLLAAAVLVFIGCSSSDITSPNDIVFPATNISFKAHVEPLMTLSCNFSGCHDYASRAGDVELTSWVGIRATKVVNLPGDTTCGLIQVVFGRGSGALHPGINVNENHRQGLKRWVIEGAQDN